MADHFRGEYVAGEHPTLFNVISTPEEHKSSQVMRFEMYQVPDIMNPVVFYRKFNSYAEYMDLHAHKTAATALKCKSGKYCTNMLRLCKDPRMEIGQYPLRLAPVFLCHRMWTYDPTRKLMVCRVPVRCFYATVDSFAARKLVLVNNNPGSNPPQHQQPTTTHGNPVSIAVSEDLVNLYENDLDKLYDGQTNRKVRLAGLIPVTLLAQSASLAFELSQFSPFLGKIRTDRIAQQPLESRKGLCRDVIFYGNGFENDESLAEVATIYNSPNNEIYYRLPPSMKTLQMNTFSYLETPNALSWLLLRHLCKYGLCNGEKVPVFQPYLYERAEKRHLINYMENFDSAGPTLTKESSRSPSSSSPPPTGLFDTIDGGGGAGSSGARANQDRPRSLGRGKVVAPIPIMATMATAASYATIARAAPKPPAPLPAIPQPHLRRSVDFFTFYAAYRPLNIKRFGEIVGCMPRFKYADDARRFSKESDFVDMVKNRVVIRDAAIRNTLDPTNKTTISAEYTRIWLTSTSSYWAVSSVTVAITPTQWSLHYGKNAPLPTVESTGKCACGDEQCYPSNFMGFEEGIAYAQKQQQQQHTW